MTIYQGVMEISVVCRKMLGSRVFGKYDYFARVYGSLGKVGGKIGERVTRIAYGGV